jgi:hypothetical protein
MNEIFCDSLQSLRDNKLISATTTSFYVTSNSVLTNRHNPIIMRRRVWDARSFVQQTRGVKIQGARSPWRLNFVRWRIIFADPHYVNCIVTFLASGIYVCGAIGKQVLMFCCFVLLFVFVYISCCCICPIISFFLYYWEEKGYTGF